MSRKPVVVNIADAEVLEGGNPMNLLADADVSDGAFSISSGTITAGADNARPHFHRRSWEVFCVVDGTLELLLDDEIVRVEAGGIAAVPPGVTHAFGATPQADVSALVFITPGVRRFDYFRLLPAILRGEIPKAELDDMHHRFDVHFVDSTLWDAHRGR
ncbi:cupin domain-containing protein [Stackebrandtia nassauensis]|uniref:Cupin 2 conserved barrel domain protein n=1 Tax=Stackebrandtia nassauensis (strain DSM 44728 / CIP 108903 / NRRL B-16338 / NBRC 102104 / LLR-40K-21) TaxID=446470 RepID=D3PZA0_STANL|nr:cupin domain-containing protein [Stackebrandtia nassauensis]ADD41574.1 Cupin 2 conserved barrel domain protein [Stackebrandtia nassauensis DSM 44728]